LDLRACLYGRRLRDTVPVQECAEARIRINDLAATLAQAKLRVLARDHRPLRLIENDLADGRIASDLQGLQIKRTFGGLLSPALFKQDDFHKRVKEVRSSEFFKF
jgi:hypothetical protein